MLKITEESLKDINAKVILTEEAIKDINKCFTEKDDKGVFIALPVEEVGEFLESKGYVNTGALIRMALEEQILDFAEPEIKDIADDASAYLYVVIYCQCGRNVCGN